MRLFDDVLTTAQYDATDLVNYPHGRVKNDTSLGAKDGTPIAEKTWGDIYNGIVELLRIAGITSSGVAEKKGASQIADAVGFLKPIAVIRAGYDSTTDAVVLFGGKYLAGYSAAFVETSVSGTTTVICKLTINKGGVLSTEKYFVQVTPAMVMPGVVSSMHNFDSDGSDYYFANDTAGNVNYYDAAGTDIDLVREVTQFIINVYKIA